MAIAVVPYFTPPPDFALTDLLQHTCDLYRPKTMGLAPGSSVEGSDFSYNHAKAYANVAWHYWPTPDDAIPRLEGRGKINNIMTLDRGVFHQSQEIADSWIVVMTTIGHPYFGRLFITQSNTLMNATAPGRAADSQWLYLKLEDNLSIPGG